MKNRSFIFLLFLLEIPIVGLAQPTSQTFNASGTYTIPAGYNSVSVAIQVWGGGGGGGTGNNNSGSGGGGGGYATATVLLKTGSFTVTVGSGGTGGGGTNNTSGTAGGTSTFNYAIGTVSASGGSGGGASTGGGAGGSFVAGTSGNSGGAGGDRNNDDAGGGGGEGGCSASNGEAGADGGNTIGGAGGNSNCTNEDGGNGGNDDGGNAGTGSAPGGGGGGGGDDNGDNNEGNGANSAAGRVIVTVNSFLPIQLASFDVKTDKNPVISWSTYAELNNSHYILERSRNGVQYGEIKQIRGSGTTDKKIEYKHIDSNPFPGTNYYRLRQVDLDGTETIYPAKSIFIAPEKTIVFPSMFHSSIFILFTDPPSLNDQWQLINTNGQLITRGQFSDKNVQQEISFGDLVPGVYSFLINGKEGKQVFKLIKT